MSERQYPECFSIIHVEMSDTGEIRMFPITASTSLMPHLMREASSTGSLVILCGDSSYAIPMNKVAQVTIQTFSNRQERDAKLKGTQSE